MNLQESIRRILREDSFINYLKRRISFDTIDKRFLNSLKYAIDVFKQRKALDYGSSHFKTLVVSDLMDDIHPLLQRHYKKEGDVYDEIYDDLENFIYGKYDEVMDQVFHEKFKKEKNINESKKLLRRFPLDEMEHIFNEALETVSEQLINSIQQNDMMSYLDFRDVIMSSILKEVWNNHKELYKYYNENEFEFTYFIYKLYGDIIFKKYMDLSKVKRDGNINESVNKKDYTKILKELVQPYYDYDGVCDIRVGYDEYDDIYDIYIVFSEEELNDKYKGELQYHLNNVSHIRRGIYNDVDNYLPINNVYVGSYQEPNCNTSNTINESEDKNMNLVIKLIHELFDEVSFVQRKNLDGKPLIKVYYDTDSTAANIDSWFTFHIIDVLEDYVGEGIKFGKPWLTYKPGTVDIYIGAEKLKYDNLGDVIN